MFYSFFSSLPIKRIFPILTGCILILLLGVLVLGSRQYILYSQCTNAVATSDKLLFEFTALQKYLSESLVGGTNQVNVSRVSEKFEQLNAMTGELKTNTLVADSLKNGLASREDYVALVADLQMMQDNPAVLREKRFPSFSNSIPSTTGCKAFAYRLVIIPRLFSRDCTISLSVFLVSFSFSAAPYFTP